ncbi:FUSC family protein [Streptomyces mirabilis]|nr:FUSC family protein [Streptomyces mirabilis]
MLPCAPVSGYRRPTRSTRRSGSSGGTDPPCADPRAPGTDTDVLRRQAAELTLAESTWIAVTAVGVSAAGRRTSPLRPRELFWYADLPTTQLWARRIVGNATHRSVWFQNAVRVACGLAIARLVAGTLDLAHGFWVLLAVLTLGRTTVGATWRAVRQAMVGNLVGAVAAGALLIALGRHLDAYAVLLVPGMLIAFALGPRLGIAYAQGLFTLVVTLAFAQITPTSWRLSEARIVDVVTGSVIGLLCGLLAWPAGARREVHRTMAGLLRSCGRWYPPRSRRCWPRRRPLRLRPRRCRRCGICVWRRPPTRSSAASHPPPGRAPRPTGTGCSSWRTTRCSVPSGFLASSPWPMCRRTRAHGSAGRPPS